jgi:hypothetical protein
MSDAFFSFINWNSRSIAIVFLLGAAADCRRQFFDDYTEVLALVQLFAARMRRSNNVI